MQLPEELKNKLDDLSNKYNENELKNAYSQISERYMKSVRNGKSLLSTEKDVYAYILARMPATYLAIYKAFYNVQDYLSKTNIKSLLDVGAGTGAATWALDSFINFEKVCCIEKEDNMISVGKILMKDTALYKKTTWSNKNIKLSDIKENADMVVSSYMLNEIEDDRKIEILDKLWNSTNKILFIIEPGTPESYKNIMNYKRYLVNHGGNVIAPCPNQGECELPENDWCHFTCRVERTRLHKNIKNAESPFEDEKFIYLIVSKEKIEGTKNRILRHPKIEKGYVKIKLCTAENGIEEKIITKKNKELYKSARKKTAGEEIELELE